LGASGNDRARRDELNEEMRMERKAEREGQREEGYFVDRPQFEAAGLHPHEVGRSGKFLADMSPAEFAQELEQRAGPHRPNPTKSRSRERRRNMATVNKRVWTDPAAVAKRRGAFPMLDGQGHPQARFSAIQKGRNASHSPSKLRSGTASTFLTRTALRSKDAADIWLGTAEANGCDRGTIKSYREIVNGHILPLLGRRSFAADRA